MTCNLIDGILKSLEELETQENLSLPAENHIRSLRVEFKYVRIFFKWMKEGRRFGSSGSDIFSGIKEGLQNAETKLAQPIKSVESVYTSYFKIIEGIKDYIQWSFTEYLQDHQETKSEEPVDIHELMVELLHPLEENMKCLIDSADAGLPDSIRAQIRKLEEKVRFLSDFLKIAEKGYEKIKSLNHEQDKRFKNLLDIIKIFAETAAVLSYICWNWRMNICLEMHVKSQLFDLLLKINHTEPEIRMMYVEASKASAIEDVGSLQIDVQALIDVNSLLDKLEELLHLDFGSVVPIDDHQIGNLRKELSFLCNFLTDPCVKQYVEPERFNSLLMQVKCMAREAGSAFHSFSVGQIKFDVIKEMNLSLHDLLKDLSLVKAEIRQIYNKFPKPSASDLPRTEKLGYVDVFLQNLVELLNYGADSIDSFKKEFERMHDELALLMSFLRDILKQHEEVEQLEVIKQHLTNVVFEAECVIDSITATKGPVSWYYMLWLSDVMEEIELLKTEVTKIDEKKMRGINVHPVQTTSQLKSEQDDALEDKNVFAEEVVGLKDQEETIRDQLQRGPQQLDIVSIVGMPGLGKTTLAKKVYEDPSITSYFHVRSWCCVSQVYERRSLLLDILDDILELTDKICKMSGDDLAEVVYRNLRRRKYLIVMDDIWNIEAWNDLRRSFPDDHNGSRIMLTSRVHDVALLAKPDSAPYHLRLLFEEESWELLQKRVFQQKSCPSELSVVGKKIAKQCKGLPLSVVVVAGFLRKTINKAHWEEIAENLGNHIVGTPGHSMAVLELSYKYLPDHLKPCFLYFGIFPEDREIPVRKLIWLWMAEGFVWKRDMKNLEKVAEGYLMDLIGRSLVMVAKSKSNGTVKACHIHDLWREFCLEKGKQENFLLPLHGNEKRFTSSDGFEYSSDHDNVYDLKPEQRRMCIYSDRGCLYGWRPSNPHVRSVHFFATGDHWWHLGGLYTLSFSFISFTLRLLRILDLYSTMVKEFPVGIELLVHLRYLALRGEINSVPSSIRSLWKLETFLVKGLRGEVALPDAIWMMAWLRHLCINDRAVYNFPVGGLKSSIQSVDLETLATPCLCYGDDMEKILRRLPGLRKLRCIFLDSFSNRFPVLDFLRKLESLKVFYHGRVQNPCELNIPRNLKRLTLSKFRLPWSEISKIGRLLPRLETLKLLLKSAEGQRWDVGDEEFLNLKFLRLDSLNIVKWNASGDHFPRLQRLELQRCKQLEAVPTSFGEISTLQMIEVRWCSRAIANSVRQIDEEQKDMGNDGLTVNIHPRDLDLTSAS